MFSSYIKTIFRNISSSKIYFFINVAGLCIGFTVFTLIMLFVLNELNYDTFNKKADRIYRVVEIQHSHGALAQQVAITMPALAPALKAEFPEVERTARFIPWPTVLCSSGEKRFYENGLAFADPSIFNIFTFHFLEGDPSSALEGPYDIVIDQTTARKYFGEANPIGKFIDIDADLVQKAFQVSGVIQDFPRDSHLHFNMIASISALERRWEYFSGWTDNDVVTYVLLKRGYTSADLAKRLPTFLKANLPKDLWSGLGIYLQRLSRIHLHSNRILYQVNYNRGDINNVRLFTLIAFFVIFLACINFINLTTARSAVRTREVGIRKLLGSYHSHLVYQFIGESIVISFVALLLSIPIVEAVLPTFDSVMRGRIIVLYNNQLQFLLFLGAVALIVGFVAGVYPAFYLSSFRPAELLRGRYSSSRRGIVLRKVLTALQFSIAIGLVTATYIVMNQMGYVQSKPLGFNKKDLMYVPLRNAESRSKIPLLRDRLLSNPNILAVSAGELTGAGVSQRQVFIMEDNGRHRMIVRESYVDRNYIETMGMGIVQGHNFSTDPGLDSSSVLINGTMARELGWRHPIGKKIHLGNKTTFSVLGVVKDFNFFSLKNKIDPLVMWLEPSRCRYLLVRISPSHTRSTIAFVEKTWESVLPTHPFEYGFLDNYLSKTYVGERENESLLGLFSVLAVLVACLGLFGLTMHATEQRIKEIGVRKVLGASVADVVMMLARESALLVAIACVISWPVVYFLMNRWLDGFAYRISLGPWTFILSGVAVFAVAMFTLSFQAVKAGIRNPAEALRYE